MTQTKSANTIARERVEDLAAGEPGWLREQRLAAWESYLQAPAPGPRDEQWRRTDFSALDLNSLQTLECGKTEAGAKTPQQPALAETAGSVFQQTGGAGYAELSSKAQQQGVIFTDWRTALEKHADLVRKHLGTTRKDDSKFTLMNEALFNCGLFLYVPANVEIAEPFMGTIQLNSAGAVFPRLVVVAGSNSKFTLVQNFESKQEISRPSGSASNTAAAPNALACILTEVHAESGAKFSYLELNNLGDNVYTVNRTQTQVARDASFNSLTVAVGGKQTKHDIATLLQAPGANSEVLGVVLGEGTEHYNFNTIQEHNATDTTSDINFRVALKDAAESTYQGIIRVDKVAQRTNAFQSNKNLLLGNEARADSIPKLEILADDVKCSHGATVGPVDHEQVFYLMSRGLPLDQAEQLIVLGFFRQVLERFHLPAVTEWVTQLVAHKLYSEPVN